MCTFCEHILEMELILCSLYCGYIRWPQLSLSSKTYLHSTPPPPLIYFAELVHLSRVKQRGGMGLAGHT